VRFYVSDERTKSDEKCGNIQPPATPSTAAIERMKLVFRLTHDTEMSQEDRDYLGIPPCAGDCCP